MIKQLSERLTDTAIDNQVRPLEDRETLAYGYRLLLSFAGITATIIVIGCFVGELWPSLCFLLFFCPLKAFAGGIHSASYRICFVDSVCIYIVNLLVAKYLLCRVEPVFLLVYWLIGSVIILLLAPVPDHNKPISVRESKVYRMITAALLAVHFILFISLSAPEAQMYRSFLIMANLNILVMVLIGRYVNHKIEQKKRFAEL